MRIKESYDLQATLVIRIKDIFSETRQFQCSHAAHLDRIAKCVWHSEEYSRIPSWRRSYLRGVYDTLFDQLYAGKDSPLVSIIVGHDARMFGPGDDSWLAESSEYKSAMITKHVWRQAWEAGEVAVF